jgi:hypothetical protein
MRRENNKARVIASVSLVVLLVILAAGAGVASQNWFAVLWLLAAGSLVLLGGVKAGHWGCVFACMVLAAAFFLSYVLGHEISLAISVAIMAIGGLYMLLKTAPKVSAPATEVTILPS